MRDVSVILCTHNPRPEYLRRVLDALKRQNLPLAQWELVIVDNLSDTPLSQTWDLSWHPRGRIISEKRLGLTAARLRGIGEATADLLVFSDDDTLMAPDYLEKALAIAEAWPMLGAWGGQPAPEFESPPPEWTRPYWRLIALDRTDRDCWSNNYDGKACPIGAGLCIRRSVAHRYAENLKNAPERSKLGRVGPQLLSGEDTDMALTACDMGLGIGRFMCLNFVHIIPDRRVTLDYLLAVREGMGFSQIIINSYRPHVYPRKEVIRLLAAFVVRALRTSGYERRFQLAAWRGEWKAVRYLAASKNGNNVLARD